jgi:hypothetical protein
MMYCLHDVNIHVSGEPCRLGVHADWGTSCTCSWGERKSGRYGWAKAILIISKVSMQEFHVRFHFVIPNQLICHDCGVSALRYVFRTSGVEGRSFTSICPEAPRERLPKMCHAFPRVLSTTHAHTIPVWKISTVAIPDQS